MARVFEQSQLFKDIRNAIFDDGYIFGIIHGPPRCSKSSLGLWGGYSVYEDWGKVLESTVFSLPSVVQRMKDGKPEKWPTANGAHSRVPYLLWDDFAVNGGNKAVSQHSLAWDEFKAAFDVLGTKIGVLMLTAVDAAARTGILITDQIATQVLLDNKAFNSLIPVLSPTNSVIKLNPHEADLKRIRLENHICLLKLTMPPELYQGNGLEVLEGYRLYGHDRISGAMEGWIGHIATETTKVHRFEDKKR